MENKIVVDKDKIPEDEIMAGVKCGYFISEEDKIIITALGKAVSLSRDITNKMVNIAENGREPTKEEVQSFLSMSLVVRKYLSAWCEHFYEKTSLWN